MTDKAVAKPDPDPELASNIATVKRGVDARVAEIKRGLAHWIGDTTTSADRRAVQRRRGTLQ